ncbi:MAG: hypothetical protein JSW52_05070 [Candidatus Coatesbacteria bacterium]|nr:MAG: hypothetical protein JSW52_05070 [Candidatus Coatesbacteria bacterium]
MVAAAVFFLGIACGGGDEEEEGKFTEIAVEEPTETTTEETETVVIPVAPVYEPTKTDVLVQLYDVLGAAEDTLGWDNVYCSITLDKSISLLDVLRPSFTAGSTNLAKCDSATKDLGNIKTTLDTYIMEGTGLDPKGTDAKTHKKTIRKYRDWIGGLISPTAPKEPISEWEGDLMKEKWHERGEMMKEKWAERGQ